MPQPLVSVVITNYNGERFIEKAIRSVLDQTYPHWELIVVDDASRDGSVEKIRRFTDPRIRLYVNERNEQVSYTHNVGIEACRGQYIAFLDNDDLWTPEKLEAQVTWMESHPETGACFTGVRLIDEYDRPLRMPEVEARFDAENQSREKWLRELLTTGNHLAKDSALVRRNLLAEMEQNDICLVQLHDYEFWLYVLQHAEIYLLRDKHLLYRKDFSGTSVSAETEASKRRTFFEYSWLVANSIIRMEEGLFCRVFHQDFRNQDVKDTRGIRCEKAFLLASDLLVSNCKSFAFALFDQFFRDPEMKSFLREQYQFTQHDIYRMTGTHIYYDIAERQEMEAALGELSVQREARKLEAEQARAQIDCLEQSVQYLSGEISLMRGSISWRMTAPVRRMKTGLVRALQKSEPVYRGAQRLRGALSHFRAARKERKAKRGEKRQEYIRRHPSLVPAVSVFRTLRQEGVKAAFSKCGRFAEPSERWYERFAFDSAEAGRQRAEGENGQTSFSVLVPLYNTPMRYLREMIRSVRYQTYGGWELCLADGSDAEHGDVEKYCRKMARKDPRIQYQKLERNLGIVGNTNACMDMASGEYIAFFDHDDLLHPSALWEAAKVIREQGADLIYTDENSFHDIPTDAFMPNYKPDYAPDTLRSYNYICHLSICGRSLLQRAGARFSDKYEGSQDYDMILRLTEKADRIAHIPKVLYYWRAHQNSTAENAAAKPYTMSAGRKAVADHLERVGLKGAVEDARIPTTYRIRYEIQGTPLISIIIPNKDHVQDLEKCVNSIRNNSTWQNWEIILVENNSSEKGTFDYYTKITEEDPRIRVVRWGSGFNFSAICNYGFMQARGEYILLLNNDMEVISPDWLQEMLMYAQRKDVGMVGAMLYYPDDTVQHAGVILGIGEVAGHAHKYLPRNSYGYMSRMSIVQNYSAVTAACAMIPRKVWEEADGMDENYMVAFNDVDFCMKVRALGYLIVWTPYAELYHYESKSRGTEDTVEKQQRFLGEVRRFRERWGKELQAGDPYYNPNLTGEREDFSPR